MKKFALIIGSSKSDLGTVATIIGATELFNEIRFAATGEAALRFLRQFQVDAVCLTLSGPLDAFAELVEHLQGHETWSNIPILLFAPRNIEKLRISALELGASDCLAYDISPREASIQIGWHLKNKRRIDNLLQLKASLARQTVTDHLTGLHNRNYFDAVLAQNVALHQRSNRPFSLLFADLDHFKQINDQFGHPAGDHVLRLVASGLRKASRLSDVICRYGGEEFAIILPDCTADQAVTVADRIHQNIREQKHCCSVTISIGIRSATETVGVDAAQMVEEADRALYMAKASGRNRTEVFPDYLLTGAKGLRENQTEKVHFLREIIGQPIVAPYLKVNCAG